MFKFDNQLPERLEIAIIDRLRIPPAKGRGVAAIEAFADSLSDRDFDIFEDWLNELDDDEKRAIGRYFDGR